MGEPDMTRFLQDWTALWREEMRAQATDPDALPHGMQTGMEAWRAAMVLWANAMSPLTSAGPRDGSGTPGAPKGAEAAAAASDARDDEIRGLARRVDELEARIAKLETPRRRRG
jgi:hypothetical protein